MSQELLQHLNEQTQSELITIIKRNNLTAEELMSYSFDTMKCFCNNNITILNQLTSLKHQLNQSGTGSTYSSFHNPTYIINSTQIFHSLQPHYSIRYPQAQLMSQHQLYNQPSINNPVLPSTSYSASPALACNNITEKEQQQQQQPGDQQPESKKIVKRVRKVRKNTRSIGEVDENSDERLHLFFKDYVFQQDKLSDMLANHLAKGGDLERETDYNSLVTVVFDKLVALKIYYPGKAKYGFYRLFQKIVAKFPHLGTEENQDKFVDKFRNRFAEFRQRHPSITEIKKRKLGSRQINK